MRAQVEPANMHRNTVTEARLNAAYGRNTDAGSLERRGGAASIPIPLQPLHHVQQVQHRP